MISFLPKFGEARPFIGARKTLALLAAGVGGYAALVLYPAYVALRAYAGGDLPSLFQILTIALCAVGFIGFAYMQMTRLSPMPSTPRTEEKPQ